MVAVLTLLFLLAAPPERCQGGSISMEEIKLLAQKGCRVEAQQMLADLLQSEDSPELQIRHRYEWGQVVHGWCRRQCDANVRRQGIAHLWQAALLGPTEKMRTRAEELLHEMEPKTGPKWISVGAIALGGIAAGIGGYSAYKWSDFQAELDQGVDTTNNRDERDHYKTQTLTSFGVGAGLLAFAIIYEIVAEQGYWGRW